jgi:citrate synthase
LIQRISKAAEARRGRRLPVNVTGAIAAISSDLGYDWRIAKAFALIGRTLGALGHIQEEIENPMADRIKNLITDHVEYTAPSPHATGS